jgi:polyisoprenoid-binding protein YceI
MENSLMKKMLALMIALTPMASLAADYEIDPAHTYPNFTISHLGFSTMHGQFAKTSGMIQMDMEKKTGAVDITIDAASIYTGHQKRDDHLRSPDFLNVVEFPEITYKSTSVKFQGKDKATVEGELTIKGVSKPVTLSVNNIVCGAHPLNKKELCGFDATATIKRTDWGVNYGMPANLSFMVEAYKK